MTNIIRSSLSENFKKWLVNGKAPIHEAILIIALSNIYGKTSVGRQVTAADDS